MIPNEQLLHAAYQYFNSRAVDKLLALMTPDVHWPNGWEGGSVQGHREVQEYWTRQWKDVDPVVTPEAFEQRADGSVAVRVHQLVKDQGGAMLSDGMVRHVYTFRDGLIEAMHIEAIQTSME
ncbi:MAG: nuclear transport factor 2 family protein [Chitinophagaceae bacterium]|nr:MAG: nuclear transport factor 2 family protein [Chitinophagaceae bacterium]